LKVTKTNSKHIRQSIANIHIVQNKNTKENLRLFYENKQYQPKDLRPKQTRAMRRLLTEKEQKTPLPKRTFAIKDE